jgi:hypothetical protein
MQPRLIEAIRLKERLTCRTYWADENRVSTVRFVVQQMMMQELGRPMTEIVPPNKPLYNRGLDPKVREKFGVGPVLEEPMPIEDFVIGIKDHGHCKGTKCVETKHTVPVPATQPSATVVVVKPTTVKVTVTTQPATPTTAPAKASK